MAAIQGYWKGPVTVLDGASELIRPKDFGGGIQQMCVGTTQALGEALYGYIADEMGNKVAAVHPGPAISFQADGNFRVIADGANVTFIIGVVAGGVKTL